MKTNLKIKNLLVLSILFTTISLFIQGCDSNSNEDWTMMEGETYSKLMLMSLESDKSANLIQTKNEAYSIILAYVELKDNQYFLNITKDEAFY